MIKLFRQIRQKLLFENKTRKYLAYAIGEIILVVIGIMIALQINTWNEKRKQSIKEGVYINSLLDDLKIQTQAINDQIQSEELSINSAKYVIDVLNLTKERNTVYDEEFYDHLTSLTSRKTFRIADATYTDLISTGELSLISDEDIKNEIVVYFQELERIESIIQNNNTHIIDDVFLPEVQKFSFYYLTGEYLKVLNEDHLSNYIDNFNPQEAAYSSSLIHKSEYNLLLKNILKQRLLVSIYHSNKMNDMLLKTKELGEKLTTE